MKGKREGGKEKESPLLILLHSIESTDFKNGQVFGYIRKKFAELMEENSGLNLDDVEFDLESLQMMTLFYLFSQILKEWNSIKNWKT